MENTVTINGHSYTFPPGADIVVRNGIILCNGKPLNPSTPQNVLEIRVKEGEVGSISSDRSVICGRVKGDVAANGSVTCDNVTGSVRAGGSVTCGRVGGNINAGGSVISGGRW